MAICYNQNEDDILLRFLTALHYYTANGVNVIMLKEEFMEIESYMLHEMQDSAHDKHHVYRVLSSALKIADHYEEIDTDVLIAACLLHDIGREKQFANPSICHAIAGGEMAYTFLLSQGWSSQKAAHVYDCISTHRFRGDNTPLSIEAKILFDADKLDVCGAIGIARTLIYNGLTSEPLYTLDDDGRIIESVDDPENTSFIQEYNYKLKNVYSTFLTEQALEIAKMRQKTAVDFYNCLLNEINSEHRCF